MESAGELCRSADRCVPTPARGFATATYMVLVIHGNIILPVFFFSSRRRHTRSLCDWSSDVCSSDLGGRRIIRSEEHTSELQSHSDLVCRLLLEISRTDL